MSTVQMWFTADGSSPLRIPVLPPSFQVTAANNNTVVNIVDFGELNLIGKTKLAEISIASFFPAQYYSNLCEYSGFPDPYTFVNTFEKWRTSGKPVRFIKTNTVDNVKNVNMPVAIESFVYGEQDGTHDVYYTLSLKEYRYVTTSQSNTVITADNYTITPYMSPESSGKSRAESKTIPTTYKVKKAESIYSLAKRLTGNGQNWYKIYLVNSLKAMTVAAGTVLKL
jgi:hypothetical protein